MYGKIFAAAFKGSMLGAGPTVFALWSWIISNCPNGTLEINPAYVAFLIGTTEVDILKALRFLTSPDPKSRSKDEGGRRLVQEGEYQYRVVNWAKYRAIRNEEERRENNRVYKQEQRERERAGVGPMTSEERVVYERKKQAEYRRRRKSLVRHAGACAGAQQAIDVGFSEVRKLEDEIASVASPEPPVNDSPTA